MNNVNKVTTWRCAARCVGVAGALLMPALAGGCNSVEPASNEEAASSALGEEPSANDDFGDPIPTDGERVDQLTRDVGERIDALRASIVDGSIFDGHRLTLPEGVDLRGRSIPMDGGLPALALVDSEWHAAGPGAVVSAIYFLDGMVALATHDGDILTFPADYSGRHPACRRMPGCVIVLQTPPMVDPWYFGMAGGLLVVAECRSRGEELNGSAVDVEALREELGGLVFFSDANTVCWNPGGVPFERPGVAIGDLDPWSDDEDEGVAPDPAAADRGMDSEEAETP